MVLPHKDSTTYKREVEAERSSEETIIRQVRSILNKITPERFDPLVRQLLDVGITNEQILRDIIALLFEKALSEPHFSSLYAQVCKVLSEKAPNFEQPDLRGQTYTTSFIKLLLANCQHEFDCRSKLFADLTERKVAEEEIMSARKKMLGNIKFIGELGKLELVSEKILHECIQRLLRNVRSPHPEDVECLCGLLQIVGKRLDHEKARAHIDMYFGRMQEMLQADLPPRIRFMIQGAAELRADGWKPRFVVAGPKTMQSIREDAMREQAARRVGKVLLDPMPDTPDLATLSLGGSASGSRGSPSPAGSPRIPGRGHGKGAVGPRRDVVSPDPQSRPGKGKRKELSAEQLANRTEGLLEELFATGDVAEAVRCVEDLKTPAHVPVVVERTVTSLLDRKDVERDRGVKFLVALAQAQVASGDKLAEGFRPVFIALPDVAIDVPHAPQHVATACVELISAEGMSLKELFQHGMSGAADSFAAAAVINGLRALWGDEKTRTACEEAKFDLLRLPPLASEPEADQRAFLAAQKLEFLYPLLGAKERVAAMLAAQVQPGADLASSARALAKALKEELPAEVAALPKFPLIIAQCMLDLVTSRTTLSSGHAHASTKEERDAEKAMLTALLPVLRRYTTGKQDHQVDVIYALQVLWTANKFPKGLILRISSCLYDEDVVEEDAWLRWKEEVNDDYPGKGEALVALNEYLNWMETADEDEEED